MDYHTMADEKRDSAKAHIQQAVEDLSEIIIRKCYGHDEYNKEYKKKMRAAFLALLDMEL